MRGEPCLDVGYTCIEATGVPGQTDQPKAFVESPHTVIQGFENEQWCDLAIPSITNRRFRLS